MGKITLTGDNTPVREMLQNLNGNVSHFNLVFYDTCKVSPNNYAAIPDSRGNDIISASSLSEAEKLGLGGYAAGAAVGISSLVRLKNGTFGHMRQLDIDESLGSPNQFIWTLEKIIETMLEGSKVTPRAEGYLVNSGSGIHYYESGLMTQREWTSWLERAERLKSVDKNWIDLSRKRGYSALRINATKEKTSDPAVFCKFSYE